MKRIAGALKRTFSGFFVLLDDFYQVLMVQVD